MSQNLSINNFDSLNIIARSFLTADLAAALGSLTVDNSNDFAAGPVLVGAPGGANSEIATATAPGSATAIPLTGTTKLAHNNGDPVFQLFGTQLKIYSAADQYGTGQQPDDSRFALVTGGTININANKAQTLFNDPAGAVGTWYKYTYYNSTSTAETTLADARAAQAGQIHYVSLDQVRRAAGFSNNPNVTDNIIAEFRDAAEKEVNGALLPVYDFPLPQPTNPIVVEIVKNIAAGELMHEMYVDVSSQMAMVGETKADLARNGGGSHTSLSELVTRTVVLTDANFAEQTIAESHSFGGWPDDTTKSTPTANGGDDGHQFSTDREY